MKKTIITILFLLGISVLMGSAQSTILISGQVLDENNQPLAGASVTERVGNAAPSNGTIADIDGNFKIKVQSTKSTLEVSMIGFETETVKLGSQTQFIITLNPLVEGLNEVVFVGYSTQTKATVTGSIATANSEVLQKSPTINVVNSLTGRLPGVTTQQTSGRPGMDDANIYIRGVSSLSGTTSPLVLVDGVERSFAQLDNNEIESVSVLKDAAATAVYGVRGANGVILVNTKRGQEGKTKISFSSEFGLQKVMRLPLKVEAWEHAALNNEGARNEGLTPQFTEEDIALYASGESPFTHPNTDYMGTFLKNAPQQKYNINLTGGNKSVRYFVSAGFVDQSGIFETDMDKLKKKGSLKSLFESYPQLNELVPNPSYDARHYYKKMNLRSNIDIDVTKDFKVSLDLGFRNETLNGPGGNAESNAYIFGVFGRTPKITPLLNGNGTFAMRTGSGVNMNPLVTLANQGFKKRDKSALEGTVKFNLNLRKLARGLSLDGKFSGNSYGNSYYYVSATPAMWSYDYTTGTYTRERSATAASSGSSVTPATLRIHGETSLKYNNSINKHHIGGLLLASIDSFKDPTISGLYKNVPAIYQGIVGRATYDYAFKYLFEVNFAYNGSNRFNKGERYALFPAVSIGWVASEEKFLKNNETLSYLKFRASAGQVGSDKLGSSFQYYNQALFVSGEGYNFGETPSSVNGIKEGLGVEGSVTWEVANKFDAGIETKWFKNKFILNVDGFYERRSGILATPGQYLYAAGINSYPSLNIGKVENKGIDIETEWNDKIGSVGYFVKGIYSFSRNKILERNEQLRAYDYMYRTGHSVGQSFGYIAEGLFQSYDEIATSASQFGTLQPGDIKYKDLNQDGVINENDITAYGYPTVPEITYSATFGIQYKGFALSAMLQGASHVSVNLGVELSWDFFNGATIMKDTHLGRWTPETASDSNTYHRLTMASTSSTNNYQSSSYYSRNASYLRLKNVEFSYTFPKSLMKKIPVLNEMRIYGSGYNLLTWDKVKCVDPESRSSSQYFYPQTQIYNLGINLTF